MPTYVTTLETLIGPLTAAVNEDGALMALYFGSEIDGRDAPGEQIDDAERCVHVVNQLKEYFAGQSATASLPHALEIPARFAPSARPTAPIPSRSSCPAIESSAQTASSLATPEVLPKSITCLPTRP